MQDILKQLTDEVEEFIIKRGYEKSQLGIELRYNSDHKDIYLCVFNQAFDDGYIASRGDSYNEAKILLFKKLDILLLPKSLIIEGKRR